MNAPLQLADSRRRLLKLSACLLLGAIFAAVHIASYCLRFDGLPRGGYLSLMYATTAMFASVKLGVFARYHLLEKPAGYATFHDLLVLVKASTVTALILAIIDHMLVTRFTIPRSILLMDWGATIVAVGGAHAVVRWVRERGLFPRRLGFGRTKALIIGASEAGESLLRSICQDPDLNFRVVGFIAAPDERHVRRVGSLPVVGMFEDTCVVAQRLGVSELLIAAGGLPGQLVRQLVEEGGHRQIAVKVVPSQSQLLKGRVNVRPRDVSIEDLLQREPVRLDTDGLRRWLENKVVMITGSAGSIGSEICRQVLQFEPARLVAVDRSECGQFFLERELSRAPIGKTEIDVTLADLNDGIRMNRLFAAHQPEIVFHAAAYKHVPLMERHPGEAVKNIALTTRGLVDLSNQYGIESFVMISTDKAVNPSSVMGACKRMAELCVQSQASRSHCRFVTVRFGNVLDSAGSVVPIFREQIARGGPITVTHPEMRRFFMTIPEASQLVIQAGAMGRGGEIFVLDMGSPVRIVDLARDLIRLSGLREGLDIEIEFTGLRPGEKLEEELLAEGEQTLATTHPKILVAASARPEYQWLAQRLQGIRRIVDGPAEELLREISLIVPDFRSTEWTVAPPSQERRAA